MSSIESSLPKNKVIITANAQLDLQRLAMFLHDNGALLQAQKLATLLLTNIESLASFPRLGRIYTFSNVHKNEFVHQESREYVIKFGKSGYKILYLYDESASQVTVISIKHAKEKNYTYFN